MITFEHRDQLPQLLATFSGRITLDDLDRHAAAARFEQALAEEAPGFVLLADGTALEGYEPEALGVLLYLSRRLFQAEPSHILLVASRVVSPRLRAFMEGLDEQGIVRYFATRAEADAFLRSRTGAG